MLALAISQGLPHGDDPVVGGVICWDSSADGHCQVIEQVIGPDEVIVTESGWNYTANPIVRTQHTYRVGGVWVYGSGYTYQGIIYPPSTPGQLSQGAFVALILDNDDWLPKLRG